MNASAHSPVFLDPPSDVRRSRLGTGDLPRSRRSGERVAPGVLAVGGRSGDHALGSRTQTPRRRCVATGSGASVDRRASILNRAKWYALNNRDRLRDYENSLVERYHSGMGTGHNRRASRRDNRKPTVQPTVERLDQTPGGPFTGPYYWVPRPCDDSLSWAILTGHDASLSPDTGHTKLWLSVLAQLATDWGKDARALKRALGDHYTGLPRGRVTRSGTVFVRPETNVGRWDASG